MTQIRRKISSAREYARKSEKDAYRYIRRAKRGIYKHNGARNNETILKNLVFFGCQYKLAIKAIFNQMI